MAMLVENDALTKAKGEIDTAKDNFKKKGTDFINTLTTTLSTFSGETKDVLMKKKIGSAGSETDGTLAYFVEVQIPQLIDGLSKLLEGNRTTIDDSDHKLAEAISGNGSKK